MFIAIDDSFESVNDAEFSALLPAFENLISAHADGWHVVVISRNLCDRLMGDERLSQRQRNIIASDIAKKVAIRMGELNSLPISIHCVPESCPEDSNSDRIKVQLRRFLNLENCQPSRLLVEHFQNDGDFILKLAQYAADISGLRAPIKLEVVHGGGVTIGPLLQNEFHNVRPLICIVDSDKSHTHDNLGETASAAVAVGTVGSLGTVRVAVLPCRELENLIPLSFLYEVYQDSPPVLEKVVRFQSLLRFCNERGHPNVLRFCDFKVGATAAKIRALPEAIREILSHIVFETTGCEVEDLDDPAVAYDGISRQLIPATLKYLESRPHREKVFRQKLFRSPFWPEVLPILDLVVGLGVGGRRLAV